MPRASDARRPVTLGAMFKARSSASSPSGTLSGQEKRGLTGRVLSCVVCQPTGADVFFLPRLGAAQTPTSLDGSEICNSTLIDYSIELLAMICHVRAGVCTWAVTGGH